ncbi:MAG TPA: major capsid protein [Methylophilaceae bacterium]|nr:major capsid protein [Methylophilaceae bacterium]
MLKKMFARTLFAVLSVFGFIQTASAAVDVTATVAEITGALTPIGLIGVAVLSVIVGIKIYKWVRRAM